MAIIFEVAVLGALFNKTFGKVKCPPHCGKIDQNKIMPCLANAINVINLMTVEQYLYFLSVRKKVDWK